MMIFFENILSVFIKWRMILKRNKKHKNKRARKKIAIKFYENEDEKWNFIEKFARFLILSLSDGGMENEKIKKTHKKKLSKIFR